MNDRNNDSKPRVSIPQDIKNRNEYNRNVLILFKNQSSQFYHSDNPPMFYLSLLEYS